MHHLSLKMEPRLPRHLSSHQILSAAGSFSSGGCWTLSVLTQLLGVCSPEGLFSFLAHLGTARGTPGPALSVPSVLSVSPLAWPDPTAEHPVLLVPRASIEDTDRSFSTLFLLY